MLFVRRPLPFPQEALLYGRRRRPLFSLRCGGVFIRRAVPVAFKRFFAYAVCEKRVPFCFPYLPYSFEPVSMMEPKIHFWNTPKRMSTGSSASTEIAMMEG